jgi:uncharacterized protein
MHPPQPLPGLDSKPWWDALAAGELTMQRCQACGRRQFPPLERCRHCAGELALDAVSGRGTVHTFIVQHHPVAPGFESLRPYGIALVALEEDAAIRLPGRILGDPKRIAIGARVRARIERIEGGEFSVPVFELIDDPN